MKKAALILCLALLPELGLAQKPVPYATEIKPPARVTKVVRVHYANAKSIAALVSDGMAVNVNADNNLQVIVLKGIPDAVASLEQAIHELDVPSTAAASRDIEVIVSVIGASSVSDLPAGQEMPETMAPVVKQLRAIFPYKNYQLLSSMLLRSGEGTSASNRGNMKGFAGNPNPGEYSVVYDNASVSSEQGRPIIHLRKFQFTTDVIFSNGRFSVGVVSDVDLPQGQKTVVGKANVESSDSALFVVLTAHLVD